MKRNSTFQKIITDFFYDHYLLKQIVEILKYTFLALLSAVIFAFGFSTFITPHSGTFVIATGGVSGLSQIIAKTMSIFGVKVGENNIQSIFYTVLNIPLVIFSFIKIGKKFTIFTAVNVVATSLFISFFSKAGGIAETVALVTDSDGVMLLDSILIRIIFAGICTGVSSAIAFVGNMSCGGIDIVTYYLGMRTSSQLGKYNAAINAFIFTIYSVICVASSGESIGYGFISVLYSALYCLIVAAVIDFINLKNKKIRVEIITTVKNMGDILISIFPHGATIQDAKGVYSKTNKYYVLMNVSSTEYKKVIAIAKKVDPNVFVTIFSVVQVYGNFYSKPVE